VDSTTVWDFDAPAAIDTCGPVSVQIVSTTTNVTDPNILVLTRTWVAVDPCSNSNTCQQTVTIITEPAPLLAISCTTNGMVQIRWPGLCRGYQLETSETLGSTGWAPVPVTPVIRDGCHVVEVTPSQPPRFYRLRKNLL
jgi:hypothetical protein